VVGLLVAAIGTLVLMYAAEYLHMLK